MKVLIDADACPVVDIAVTLCRQFHTECILMCDTAHVMQRDGVQTLIFDKGADSVDFALVNRVAAGDVVITQDYGLASMCLAKRARILHQDGWEYTEYNISGLMEQRHAAKKFRMAGGRTKGPSKRRPEQDEAFRKALQKLLQQSVQG
ncbi:MAG: YaiI/YqxD family protein [Oscillospiraceae bacterium]|nr:YaiI/YqxD family protein [Oscillospiraceae bacterium]